MRSMARLAFVQGALAAHVGAGALRSRERSEGRRAGQWQSKKVSIMGIEGPPIYRGSRIDERSAQGRRRAQSQHTGLCFRSSYGRAKAERHADFPSVGKSARLDATEGVRSKNPAPYVPGFAGST